MMGNLFYIDHKCNNSSGDLFADGFFEGLALFPNKIYFRNNKLRKHVKDLCEQSFNRDLDMYRMDLENLRKDFEAAQEKMHLENEQAK